MPIFIINNFKIIYIQYDRDTQVISKTEKLEKLLKEDKAMFDMFYDQFPVYVMRPDGTKGFLRFQFHFIRIFSYKY